MKSAFLSVCFFLSFFVSGIAQEISNPYTDSIFTGKKEIYFKFHIVSRQEINAVTRIISIDKVTSENDVYAYAGKKEFIRFLLTGYEYEILKHPGDLIINPLMFDIADIKQINAWDAYPTYSAYEAMMYQFAADYPSLCEIYNIKTLASGRKLLVAKLSHNISSHENEPQFLYTSTMHGNETSGYIHMLHLIDTLLNGYGSNTRITYILDNTELWINPLANPDGTYDASGGSSIAGATRGNINGIDLNRNYPDPVGGQHPDGEVWQAETEAFMDFADTMNFVMSANFHEGAEVCNYPWDCKADLTADDNWWQYVSHEFADTAQTFGPSGFFTDVDPSGIINGYAWYQILGGRQDYMNYFQHCREECIEISSSQSPDGSQLVDLWEGCRRSLLNYIEQSLNGIRGVITDSCTGQGICAKVFITGHDFDSSHVYSALPVGNYHRPIYTGTYNLTFSAPGYQSKTYNNITVTNGNTVIQNVVLKPLAPVAAFIANITSACSDTIQFSDLSGGVNTWLWDFGDGTTSTLQNPSHFYASSGIYTVSLTVSNCAGSDVTVNTGYISITKPDDPIVTPGYNCGPASLTLSATGSGTLNWYDAETGGNLVYTGTTFTTPFLTGTTTYFVQAVNQAAPQSAGKPDDAGSGGYLANPDQYLIFDSYVPFILISVNVYPGSAGSRTIELRNNSGTVLNSATINITGTTMQTLSLNFPVPAGSDLQLGLQNGTSADLYRNNGGVTYPYTTAGVLSVTGSSAGSQYYYYFYGWQVQEEGCASDMIPVIAAIDTLMPVASFSYSLNGSTCDFTNTTQNGATYNWDFGDGNSSTDENPSHTYTANGTYDVQLIVINGCGSDTIIQQVNITNVGIDAMESDPGFSVFPNPSDGSLNIFMNSAEIKKIVITDLTGNIIYESALNTFHKKSIHHIDMTMFSKGIYILNLETWEKNFYSKIILQ
ncbi:MAG: M14 family zinc carboxypeptidase [Bacteroidota bacterium]